MSIGEKIRDARTSKGMTQEELGEALGVQKSAIAKYENGRVVNIKRSTLKKISDILSIPPSELIFGEIKNEKPAVQGELSEYEKTMLEIFRLIPEDQQKIFLEMGRAFANSLKKG